MTEQDTPMDTRPAFRQVELRAVDHDNQSGVVITDPLGISPEQIFVPEGLLPIVGRFDGTRTVLEIEAEIRAATGASLPSGMVAKLAGQMDEFLFLNTSRFRAALAEACEEFVRQPVRPASHAGRSAGYPSTQAATTVALDSMIHRPRGPLRATPRGLVAPHIDLARGREGYSMAYSALAECEPADLYVVFGTGHQGPTAPVTGLAMGWETPLGTMQTDGEFVAGIHAHLGAPQPTDLFLHRQEHSLEFQMLFLAHVTRDHPCQVAGFLTGHLPHGAERVEDEPYVRELLGAFREECDRVTRAGRRVCFVAGADLAHIGPKFDDPDPIDQARLERLSAEELPKLTWLEAGDPSGFHAAVEGPPGNMDRICGTTPMFLAAALADCPARLLHYGQAAAEDGSETVSYCAMVFEGCP